MFRNFRRVLLGHLERYGFTEFSRHIPCSPTEADPTAWRTMLSRLDSSTGSFSPKMAVDVISRFSGEYQLCAQDRRTRREMINDQSFIKLLSSCVKHLSAFGPRELIQLIHLTTVRIDWRDTTILRSLEPVILDKLQTLTSTDLIDCLEAYGRLRCGSRPLWESLISAITSVDLSHTDVLRTVKLVSENKGHFYKPIFALRSLFPVVEEILKTGSITNEEIRNVVAAYSDWDKAIVGDLKFFLSLAASRVDLTHFDLHVFADIITPLADLQVWSSEVESFLAHFSTLLLQQTDLKISTETAVSLSKTAVGFHRFAHHVPLKDELFVFLEGELCGQAKKIPEKLLPKILSVFSRTFELVNVPSGNEFTCSPRARRASLLDTATPVLLKRSPHMSARQVAKIMEAFAIARKGSPELWSSLITVMDQLLSSEGASELSPEDVSSVLFALAEMNMDLSAESKNALILSALERLNLFSSFDELVMFAALQLDAAEAASVLAPVIEMIDAESIEESKRPSVVFLNLALRPVVGDILASTDTDVELFFDAAKSIIHPAVVGEMKRDVEAAIGVVFSENILLSGGLKIDFFSKDTKTAILVSSPLLVIDDGKNQRPSGTALLRHKAVQAALPGWNIINISASEYVEKGKEIIDLLLQADGVNDVSVPTEESAAHQDDEEERDEFTNHNEEENDMSKFLRKDRHAAHRKRAPPAESLPWVPSVLTLKSGRRRKPSRRPS